jgi:hypothetical protein
MGSPPACSATTVSKAASKSGLDEDTSSEMSCTPKLPAARCVSANSTAAVGLAGLQRSATRETPGTASWRSGKRLPLSPAVGTDSPVTFPPGRARLAT